MSNMDELPFKMDNLTASRLNAAAKIIEYDGFDGFLAVRRHYGENIANALIVAWLRNQLNDKPDQYPCPEDLEEKVKAKLKEKGLL